MNTEAFIDSIRTVVYHAAAKGTIDLLQKPPGKRPDADLIRLSDWYHHLSSEDRENIARVIYLAANQATYNFLLVLDGLLAVEQAGPKGKLELSYDNGKARTRLNDNNAEQLSFLFKQRD